MFFVSIHLYFTQKREEYLSFFVTLSLTISQSKSRNPWNLSFHICGLLEIVSSSYLRHFRAAFDFDARAQMSNRIVFLIGDAFCPPSVRLKKTCKDCFLFLSYALNELYWIEPWMLGRFWLVTVVLKKRESPLPVYSFCVPCARQMLFFTFILTCKSDKGTQDSAKIFWTRGNSVVRYSLLFMFSSLIFATLFLLKEKGSIWWRYVLCQVIVEH